MRLLLVFLSVLFSVPALAQAPKQVEVINDPLAVEVVNPPAPAAVRWQLVGFSSGSINGLAGYLGLSLTCQQSFPESRVCTSLEVMDTTTIPSGLLGDAWVRPHFVSGGSSSVDASGVKGDSRALTCSGWGEGRTGLTVNATGAFGLLSCAGPIVVACCALVP